MHLLLLFLRHSILIFFKKVFQVQKMEPNLFYPKQRRIKEKWKPGD